jgi:hypothetical protein
MILLLLLITITIKSRPEMLIQFSTTVLPSSLRPLDLLIALMMEATRTSETLVNFYQTTRRYNPEDSHLSTHRREKLNPTKRNMPSWCHLQRWIFQKMSVIFQFYCPWTTSVIDKRQSVTTISKFDRTWLQEHMTGYLDTSYSLEQCSATGVPPQGFGCAANFYKKLRIRTI